MDHHQLPGNLSHQSILDQAGPLAILDLQANYRYVNPALCALLDITQSELIGQSAAELTPPQEHSCNELISNLLTGQGDDVVPIWYLLRDQTVVWALVSGNLLYEADEQPHWCLIQLVDVTAKAHLALHDSLTGLPNRALFSDRVDHELAQLPRTGEILALLLIDIDDLKATNDRYGHAAGDQLLTVAAVELHTAARCGDTVARLGGDEFALAGRVDSQHAADTLRERICGRMHVDFAFADVPLRLSASVGLSITENPRTTAQDVLDSADRDMYNFKRHRHRTDTFS